MVSLDKIKVGQKVKIFEFIDPEVKCYSSRFGIEEGQLVTCIAKPGPIVIRKKQQEIAIAKKLSKQIYVTVV